MAADVGTGRLRRRPEVAVRWACWRDAGWLERRRGQLAALACSRWRRWNGWRQGQCERPEPRPRGAVQAAPISGAIRCAAAGSRRCGGSVARGRLAASSERSRARAGAGTAADRGARAERPARAGARFFRAGLAGHGRGGSSGERAARRAGAYGLIHEWAQPNRRAGAELFPLRIVPARRLVGGGCRCCCRDGAVCPG